MGQSRPSKRWKIVSQEERNAVKRASRMEDREKWCWRGLGSIRESGTPYDEMTFCFGLHLVMLRGDIWGAEIEPRLSLCKTNAVP